MNAKIKGDYLLVVATGTGVEIIKELIFIVLICLVLKGIKFKIGALSTNSSA
jgi:hypothetical protein